MARPGPGISRDPGRGPADSDGGDQPLPYICAGMGGPAGGSRDRQDGGIMTNHIDRDQHGAPALASRLRAARESKGLTQAQAASELGVSRPLLIAIEKGTRDASPEETVRLAEIYGKSASELLRPSAPPVAIGARFRAALASAPHDGELSGAVTRLEDQADNYLDLLRRAKTDAPGRYPAARSISHLDPWQDGEDLATEERNRLRLGDGPIRQPRGGLGIEG